MDRRNLEIRVAPPWQRHGVVLSTLAVVMASGIAGCFGYRPDLPPTERVTGTVTLDGQPVANARVQFVPDKLKGTTGAMASGTTNAQGEYELETATVKGAIVGHHKVSVEARAPPKDEYDTLPELLTADIYADHENSGLTAEVIEGRANVIDFPLTTEPQAN